MKLYTCSGAPSPRRVTLFLELKGIAIDQVEVDLRSGEHLSDEFAAKSPDCTVPVLGLEDGSCLWETNAIRRFLEEQHPEPALYGSGLRERAEINQWTDWVFTHGLLAVMEAFRNRSSGFRDHALTGRRPVAQISELAVRGRERFGHFLGDLDQRLQQTTWIGGESLSVADIDALVTIDFAARAIKLEPDSSLESLARWYQAMSDQIEK